MLTRNHTYNLHLIQLPLHRRARVHAGRVSVDARPGVDEQKVVELNAGSKLNYREIKNLDGRFNGPVLFFETGGVEYSILPSILNQNNTQPPDKRYVSITQQGGYGSNSYPQIAAPQLPVEVLALRYSVTPADGCRYITVYRTRKQTDGTISTQRDSVATFRYKCEVNKVVAEQGKQLMAYLSRTGQQADVYLQECDQNQYYRVNANGITPFVGSLNTSNGTNSIIVTGCWNAALNQWDKVSHGYRSQPTLNGRWAGKASRNQILSLAEPRISAIIEQKRGTPSGNEGGIGVINLDGFRYQSLDMFAAIVNLKDYTKTLIETANVPERVWNSGNPAYANSPVNVPPVLAGGADQVIEEGTDALQLVNLALDLGTDPGKAKEIWNGIRNLWPGGIQTIIKEHAATYSCNCPKAPYQAGRDGVTVAFMWKGLVGLAAKAAASVKSAGTIIVGLTTGSTKIADDVLELLVKLRPKFSSDALFDAFKADFQNNA